MSVVLEMLDHAGTINSNEGNPSKGRSQGKKRWIGSSFKFFEFYSNVFSMYHFFLRGNFKDKLVLEIALRYFLISEMYKKLLQGNFMVLNIL